MSTPFDDIFKKQNDSSHRFVRVWKEFDLKEVNDHLLLVDDLYGSCAKCKQLGLNYTKDKTCPNCGTTFRYLATHLKSQGEVRKILSRIKSDGLNLTVIDRADLEGATARDNVQNIFKKDD